MRLAMITFASVFAANVMAANTQELAERAALTEATINDASLDTIAAEPLEQANETTGRSAPDPAIVRLQILLDRAGASPGVIDGFDGENVHKAVEALETMRGLPVDGKVDPDLVAALATAEPVVGHYTITEDDVAAIVPPIPSDYAEMAKRDFLGYTSVEEAIAERFHMDIDFLKQLNAGTPFTAGSQVLVAAYGP
ncbi:MAG TPA: peptidoglycan-binding domain-containing protein, partial [Devosia sp.]